MFKTILIPQDVPRKDALFCILKSLQEIDDASNELFLIFNTRITACKKRLIAINRRIDVVCRKADSIKEVFFLSKMKENFLGPYSGNGFGVLTRKSTKISIFALKAFI
jgi:hypothetical protein